MAAAYDLAIIGGGINGCGIARDAAGRGLAVHLCEMGDLAEGTSSRSTGLIMAACAISNTTNSAWCAKALREREVLWRIAPHIVRPLRFVLPHRPGLRAAWLLRLGLFVYDHLGGRKLLPPTRVLDLGRDPAGAPLKPGIFRTGLNIPIAESMMRGWCCSTPAMPPSMARPSGPAPGPWRRCGAPLPGEVTMEDTVSGRRETIEARVLVNATGPWAAQSSPHVSAAPPRSMCAWCKAPTSWCRGCSTTTVLTCSNPDGRIVFAIPFERAYTLIGTTDRDFAGDPATVAATPEEIAYLCDAASFYFARPVVPDDVVWSFSGVRPLHDDHARDPDATTRDYVLELDAAPGRAALLTVFGGTITTYRRLAEAALVRLAPRLPPKRGIAPAGPGSAAARRRFRRGRLAALTAALATEYEFLTPAHAGRLASSYGTRAKIFSAAPRSRRSRRLVRSDAHASRGALPDDAGMGANRRRCAVASQ